MGKWIALVGDDLAYYEAGEIAPLAVREVEQGIEVWMPHEWQYGLFTGMKTCSECGLLPLEYDAIETPCGDDDGEIKATLEYLRGEIRAERISYGEIATLQGLAEHIEPGDVELLEWAGVPEHGCGCSNPYCQV